MREINPISAGHTVLGVMEAPNRKLLLWWQPGSVPESGLTFDGATVFASMGAAKIALRSSYVTSLHSFDSRKRIQCYVAGGRVYTTVECECGCGLTMKQQMNNVEFYEKAELIEK